MNRRSLILITVDCLRADRIGFCGYPRPLIPFLDSLAKESIVFPKAIVAGAPTYFSFPAIMASRYPLGLGRDIVGLAPGEPTIATVLREAGYETAAFIAGNPYLNARFGYDQGFDEFSDFLDVELSRPSVKSTSASSAWSRLNRRLERISSHTEITAAAYSDLYFRYCQWRSAREDLSMNQLRRYPAANVLVDAACSWLRKRSSQPFFLWVHLMDPHHPYYPPVQALESLGLSGVTPRRARFLNSFWNRGDISPRRLQRYRKHIMALYDAGVHWVDQQLARLVEALKAQDQWPETIFVVTADHGEEFLEHGRRYHSPTGLPEQLIRVPLIVRASGTTGKTLPGYFSLIHLAPTLLEALEIDSPSSFTGRRMWKEIAAGSPAGLPSIVECVESCNNQLSAPDRLDSRLMAVLDGDYKLVLRFREWGDNFYNVKQDPSELQPLPDNVQTKERARLLQVARDHLRDARERRDFNLSLRARFREIRHHIELNSAPTEASLQHSAAEI